MKISISESSKLIKAHAEKTLTVPIAAKDHNKKVIQIENLGTGKLDPDPIVLSKTKKHNVMVHCANETQASLALHCHQKKLVITNT